MTTIGRTVVHGLLHDEHCHCKWHWRASRENRVIRAACFIGIYTAILWLIGLVCIWAAKGFPGLTRIG